MLFLYLYVPVVIVISTVILLVMIIIIVIFITIITTPLHNVIVTFFIILIDQKMCLINRRKISFPLVCLTQGASLIAFSCYKISGGNSNIMCGPGKCRVYAPNVLPPIPLSVAGGLLNNPQGLFIPHTYPYIFV